MTMKFYMLGNSVLDLVHHVDFKMKAYEIIRDKVFFFRP